MGCPMQTTYLEEIKKLKKAGKFEEAIRLIEKYPNNKVIQAQIMAIYEKQNRDEEAEKIAKKFYDYPPIQSRMIKIYIKKRNYKKAKEIGERFENNPHIQSQMVTIYMKERNYEEAKKVAVKFQNIKHIQSQMIKIYIQEKNYEEAKKIGKRFMDYEPIQSQMIKIYIQEKNYEVAKEIGKRFMDYKHIQSQIIKIYMQEGNYEEAKKIGERFKDDPIIQSQIITIYMREGEYKKAKETGERFKDDPIIQSQMSELYNMEKKSNNKEKYTGNKSKSAISIDSQINSLRIKIYYEEGLDIGRTIEQIEKDYANTNKWTITLIKIALADRTKSETTMRNIINSYIRENKNNAEEKKHIKILKQLQQGKRRIFNKEFYDELIDWEKLNDYNETIYNTMNPVLKQIVEQCLSNEGIANKTREKINKYINCGKEQKNALMRFILEMDRLGIAVRKYYPNAYDKYNKIKKVVIDSRILDKRNNNNNNLDNGEQPDL